MYISDVKIRATFSEGQLKAIASVTIDNAIAIHDIKIVEVKDRLILIIPSRDANTRYQDIVHPINSDVRQMLHDAVIEAYYRHLQGGL